MNIKKPSGTSQANYDVLLALPALIIEANLNPEVGIIEIIGLII
ncbi:MAG: hypothetical protein ACJA0H_000393 [Francisellaceae bacterium]|jgi:hypothetical protein